MPRERVASVISIRRERAADAETVSAVTHAAFAQPGSDPVEPALLDALRADPAWLPALSLVAIDADGTVVGHVTSTRATCGDEPALGLGPVSVRPDRQGGGVGTALLHASAGAAQALGEPLIVLLGDPAFYTRAGFVPAADVGVHPPVADWAPHFLALPLDPDHPRGAFRYAAPFEALDG